MDVEDKLLLKKLYSGSLSSLPLTFYPGTLFSKVYFRLSSLNYWGVISLVIGLFVRNLYQYFSIFVIKNYLFASLNCLSCPSWTKLWGAVKWLTPILHCLYESMFFINLVFHFEIYLSLSSASNFYTFIDFWRQIMSF